MYGNDFWQELEVRPEQVAHENKHYVVIVTPKVWREQASAETDRPLTEYVVVNRLYKTIESTAAVLSTAVQYADKMSEILDVIAKEKEPPVANVFRIKGKDNPE